MMWFWRAIFLLLLLLLSGWGWQLYAEQQLELARLDQNQATLTQQVADLNDRLVAVARTQAQPNDVLLTQTVITPEQAELMRQNIRQSLTLAQYAIQRGQATDADALLLSVQAVLQGGQSQQWFAPAVLQGLQRAIQMDRAAISQAAQQQQTGDQSLERALIQIQQQLDQMARQAPVLHLPDLTQPTDSASQQHSDHAERSWLDRLAQVVSIQRVSPEQQVTLAQRALLCREVALTVGLARHALRQQQPDQLRALLREAIQQLSRLPDAQAVQARQRLTQLLATPLPAVVPLRALALLPERASS